MKRDALSVIRFTVLLSLLIVADKTMTSMTPKIYVDFGSKFKLFRLKKLSFVAFVLLSQTFLVTVNLFIRDKPVQSKNHTPSC